MPKKKAAKRQEPTFEDEGDESFEEIEEEPSSDWVEHLAKQVDSSADYDYDDDIVHAVDCTMGSDCICKED